MMEHFVFTSSHQRHKYALPSARSEDLSSWTSALSRRLKNMSSLLTSLLSLLEDLKYSLLQLWSGSRVQHRGIFTIGAILGLIVLYTARYLASPYRKLPPGPRGYPIIGNLLEMRGGQWLKFSKWQKKYGQLVIHRLLPISDPVSTR
jgi:hypothetical protein